ncbi:MAG: SHOCT domain-containing protein [Oscillospiraceae bacterium]|nr:SHOCT domain-containing protein [Oscillospiraceae bacterium]
MSTMIIIFFEGFFAIMAIHYFLTRILKLQFPKLKISKSVCIAMSIIGGVLSVFGVVTIFFNYNDALGWTADYDTLYLAMSAMVVGVILVIVGAVLRKSADNSASVTSKQDPPQNITLSAAKELGEWKELLDKGIITQEDFDLKKRELLSIGQKPRG